MSHEQLKEQVSAVVGDLRTIAAHIQHLNASLQEAKRYLSEAKELSDDAQRLVDAVLAAPVIDMFDFQRARLSLSHAKEGFLRSRSEVLRKEASLLTFSKKRDDLELRYEMLKTKLSNYGADVLPFG